MPHTRESFLSSFQIILHQLEQEVQSFGDLDNGTIQYLRKMSEYNVPHGKLLRGIMTVNCYQELVGSKATQDDIKNASVLGWSIEWLQASFLVLDDIMDNSVTRRGQACWYKLPTVGLKAINDGLLLEGVPDCLLRLYFSSNEKLYIKLRHLFDEVKLKCQIGQYLDTSTSDLNPMTFTQELYDQIVKYKTAYYTFYLPFMCAVLYSGLELSKEDLELIYSLAMSFGNYFQIQDDYLDCYGDPSVTGKIGTDIQDKKCSWLAVTFLKLALPEDLAVFEANYGLDNEDSIEKIKKLYERKGLKDLFLEFEKSSFALITQRINAITNENLRKFFEWILALLFKRNK